MDPLRSLISWLLLLALMPYACQCLNIQPIQRSKVIADYRFCQVTFICWNLLYRMLELMHKPLNSIALIWCDWLEFTCHIPFSWALTLFSFRFIRNVLFFCEAIRTFKIGLSRWSARTPFVYSCNLERIFDSISLRFKFMLYIEFKNSTIFLAYSTMPKSKW